jgi:hypothetical protein
MLEEFAYLKSQEGGKVNLDLLPLNMKAVSQYVHHLFYYVKSL